MLESCQHASSIYQRPKPSLFLVQYHEPREAEVSMFERVKCQRWIHSILTLGKHNLQSRGNVSMSSGMVPGKGTWQRDLAELYLRNGIFSAIRISGIHRSPRNSITLIDESHSQ